MKMKSTEIDTEYSTRKEYNTLPEVSTEEKLKPTMTTVR